MPMTERLVRASLTAIATVVLFTSTGCPLPHANLAYSRVVPAQYCPGDTLTSTIDIAGTTPCVSHSGLDCAAIAPRFDVTSTSAALPPYTFTGYTDTRSFMPTEAQVSVTFQPTPADPQQILIPIRDASGANAMTSRKLGRETRIANRVVDGSSIELTHGGMCNGSSPVNAPARLPGPPETSGRLIAQSLCNTNTVPVLVTVTSAAGGSTSGMLAAGGCLPLGFPANGGMVAVTPAAIAPGTQCSATQQSTPPPTLKTQVVVACGN